MIVGKITVVAVLGYGCQQTKEMREYLDKVTAFVHGKKHCIIITTGGFTDRKNKTRVSEAQMMTDYLRQKGVTQEIILEEKARTTNENICRIAEIMCERGFMPYAELTVFCDWSHKIKVACAAASILDCDVGIATHKIIRSILGLSAQLVIATPLCIAATLFPPLQRLEVFRKERMRV